MEQTELIKRIDDLAERCRRSGSVTHSCFLTPAESYEAEKHALPCDDVRMIMTGGTDGCERQVAFFLPDYLEESFDPGKTVRAIRITSFFGSPGHRDYLGAILALGIERDRVGDILMDENTATVFCLSSVAPVLMRDLEKVGRCGVKTQEISPGEVTLPERKMKTRSFTVKSLRLDAVTGDLFGMSRTSAAEMIRLGAVSLNYSVCEKTDAPVREGDILSVRGKGKGRISAVGGKSKKDRLFVEAELYQ